jgi:hypothetical protein
VRKAVYVLPSTPETLEDFQWLRQEILDAGGVATVFLADAVGSAENEELVRAFQEARDGDYEMILDELKTLERADRKEASPNIPDELVRLRQRLDALVAIDFFEAPKREKALAACQRCEEIFRKTAPAPEPVRVCDPAAYQKRRWVTRKGIHIDRVSSAWLIRRYIDPEARFSFVEAGTKLRKGDVPFDMFEAEFGHHGEDCTFETLVKAFALDDSVVEIISRIVHDADVKDEKFGRRDTEGIEKTIRALGFRLSDKRLLEVGLDLFDGLAEVLRQERGSGRGESGGKGQKTEIRRQRAQDRRRKGRRV